MSRLRISLPVDICFCHIRLYYPPPYPSRTYLPFPLLHLILILYLPVLLSYHGPRQKIHDAAVPRDHVRCTTYLIKPTYGACCVTLLPMHLFFPFPSYGLPLLPSLARRSRASPISHLPPPIFRGSFGPPLPLGLRPQSSVSVGSSAADRLLVQTVYFYDFCQIPPYRLCLFSRGARRVLRWCGSDWSRVAGGECLAQP